MSHNKLMMNHYYGKDFNMNRLYHLLVVEELRIYNQSLNLDCIYPWDKSVRAIPSGWQCSMRMGKVER